MLAALASLYRHIHAIPITSTILNEQNITSSLDDEIVVDDYCPTSLTADSACPEDVVPVIPTSECPGMLEVDKDINKPDDTLARLALGEDWVTPETTIEWKGGIVTALPLRIVDGAPDFYGVRRPLNIFILSSKSIA
jgi:hypothetical protein